MDKNRQLLSRIVFLGIFVVAIFVIFWLGQALSKDEEVQAELDYEAGKATLVEYADFQCPACETYYPLVKQLKAEFGDKIVMIYKHFPLQQIHKNANLAARASEAALIQGKFWEMHNIIFEKQKEWSDSTQASALFTDYALEVGLYKEKFLGDVGADTVYDKVNDDYQEGVRLGVRGTPTFFLNGKKIINPRGYDEFKELIERALQ